MVVSPVALLLVPVALAALAVAGRRRDRRIAGELSEPVWAACALSVLVGTLLVVLGLVRRFAPHARRSIA